MADPAVGTAVIVHTTHGESVPATFIGYLDTPRGRGLRFEHAANGNRFTRYRDEIRRIAERPVGRWLRDDHVAHEEGDARTRW